MAASPQVMQALTAGKGGPGAPPGAAPPGAAPMMAPTPPAGLQEGAAVQVLMAQKILEKSLAAFGSGDPKGKAIIQALGSLGRAFGKKESKTEELMPAEMKEITQALAGPGAGPKPAAPPAPPAGGPPPG